MWGAIAAVFGSWMNDRAIVYRRQYGIPHDWGTAANICSMVFGNMGDDCGTGVAFTRDPATGENVFYGEYLSTPRARTSSPASARRKKIAELGKDMPAAYKQLVDIRKKLEKHYSDMQDIEFTIQKGKLWMLQTPQRQAHRLRRRALRRRHGRRGADHRRRRRCAGGIPPATRTSSCSRSSTAAKKAATRAGGCSPRASTPAPARPRARSCSSPTTPRRWPRKGETKA